MSEMLVWEGQAAFMEADTPIISAFTGAGWGKSKILARRAVDDGFDQDGWWLKPGAENWSSNRLKMIMGAPHDKYLTLRLIPEFRGFLDEVEMNIGRSIRATTGRNRDGWFGTASGRIQEMGNGVDYLFYPLYSAESAVAMDAAGLYIDEVTMLTDVEIWNRSTMRCRDPRALKRTIACVGTPEEDHFIYELLIDPDTKQPRAGVTVVTDSSVNNPMLDISYFERLGHQATYNFKEMQVMGRWVAGAGGQRFGGIWSDDKHLRPMNLSPLAQPTIQYDIGWDPGYRTGNVVVMYRHPRGFWAVVDEVVIQDMTTSEVCDILLERGYNKSNIRYLGMDPRDANKRRSTSRVSDADIVYKKMSIHPVLLPNSGNRARLRNRLDVIAELLKAGELVVNKALKPSTSQQLGIVNAIKQFSTKRTAESRDSFIDKPTRDTLQRWKHPIDALHYVFSRYETGVYRRVDRENYERDKRSKR